jgi:hypothetical protein
MGERKQHEREREDQGDEMLYLDLGVGMRELVVRVIEPRTTQLALPLDPCPKPSEFFVRF